MTPKMSGPLRSGYSAKENAGDAIQIRGTKNATQARTKRPVSSGVLWLLATLTLRLRRPCGARMAIITTVAARTTAFAIHGFMAITVLFHPADCDRVEGRGPANGMRLSRGDSIARSARRRSSPPAPIAVSELTK